MWTYQQCDGMMLDPSGQRFARGYSGRGVGENNPAMQDHTDLGPIPCGQYIIDPPVDTGGAHGPYVLALIPKPGNQMFGRAGFLIHGDSIEHPGTASKGCIVLGHFYRETIWASGDHELQVVSGLPNDAEQVRDAVNDAN